MKIIKFNQKQEKHDLLKNYAEELKSYLIMRISTLLLLAFGHVPCYPSFCLPVPVENFVHIKDKQYTCPTALRP